jgi:hypothetical protein
MIGPIAGPYASDALDEHDPTRVALFFVDEDRWWVQMPEAPSVERVARLLYERDPRELARFFRRLFELEHDEFIFEYEDGELLSLLTKNHRELAPRDEIRRQLKSWNHHRAGLAATRLVEMAFPEDADAVIEAMLRGTGNRAARVNIPIAEYLGAHPRSDELIPRYPEEADAIREARRAAGLLNSPER